MGASQSTGGGAAPTANAQIKTSYYELLGIERSATEDDIKKAYRRKALELHPDRNYGDVERATTLFAEIQSAYEVLSDPQERSWYDAHEGDILRGGAGEGGEDHYEHNMKVTTADDIARMLGKFRGNVEFSDAPNGFFGFVRETFETLAKEEEAAADWEGVEVPYYPSFGHKDDTYEDVVREFYGAWSGFATKKTFAWKDQYRLSEAPDRRVRRLMEKENQKLRDAGIREFNDAVNSLLLFVRRRDPRYTPNTQTADERAKAQRESAKAQAARAKAARAKQMEGEIPEWATRRDPDEVEEESEEEIEEEHYECVACNKVFKSERQWEAHEKSKKHQKAVNALKKKMRKDNAHLNLDEDVTSSGVITPVDDDDLSGDGEDAAELDGSVDDADELAEEMEDLDMDGKPSEAVDTAEHSEEESEDEDADKQQPPSTNVTSPEPNSEDSDSDDEYASRSKIEARLASDEPLTLDIDTPDSEPTTGTSTPKLGKAAQKRLKRAAKQAEIDQSELKHKCVVCNAAFPSKNQLFQHVKDLDHAAPISVTKGGGGGAKKKGKRK